MVDSGGSVWRGDNYLVLAKALVGWTELTLSDSARG